VPSDDAQLAEQAKAVLDDNWTGAFTKPAPRLYPHQWSWDSAFIAMAYAHYDQDRAQRELEHLFRGQWANGLLPHIVFNPAYTAYAPGPEFWQTRRSPHAPRDPQTSGIVQPPVHATAVLYIYRYAQDRERARAFLTAMFPRLRAWHAYLYRERDPDGEGLVYIRHPWESGQDNSPIWDPILQRIQVRPEEVPAYRRVDTELVDAEERPGQAEYDRYAYLVGLAAARDYDEARIRHDCPFLVQDVLFNTLLCQANRDLAEIARVLGEDPAPFEAWAAQTAAAINARLWNEEHAIYFDFDLRAGAPIHAHVAAGFAPLYAGIPDRERAERMCGYLNTSCFCRLADECYAVPSYDKHEPGYSPSHYWRGPVWININWLLYHGLRRYGFDEYARWVRQAILDLPRHHGFYEYYDPDEGRGHGAGYFSWTAALCLDVLFAG
jgi:glycogen debranching enzyme